MRFFADFSEYLKSVHFGHFNVQEHQVVVRGREEFQSFASVTRLGHCLEAEFPQGADDTHAHHLAIVHHQDFCIVNGLGG